MADAEAKGKQLMAEAEKKLSSSKGFFGALFGYENMSFDVYLIL